MVWQPLLCMPRPLSVRHALSSLNRGPTCGLTTGACRLGRRNWLPSTKGTHDASHAQGSGVLGNTACTQHVPLHACGARWDGADPVHEHVRRPVRPGPTRTG